jgi:hypothetical protein
MDVDDIYDVVAPEIAQRTGRSLDNPEANPKYGQVETVLDVVQFFWHQPRVRRPDRPLQPSDGGLLGNSEDRS